MDRVAVFVDAGYLFAQGSAALAEGGKRPRTEVALSPKAAIDELKAFSASRASHCSLLRIYWYDGTVSGSKPTSEQSFIADLDDVKLRLGFINSHGQQKGVDSLIVTDLIELSRLGAISDAILLAGDEDLRVGVQIAQNYGVRVHLLGVVPSRGSQSRQLMREADTTSEWDRLTVEKFLSLRPKPKPSVEDHLQVLTTLPQVTETSLTQNDEAPPMPGAEAAIADLVVSFVETLGESDIRGIQTFWKDNVGAPSDIDRMMLVKCRSSLGRNLEKPEMKHMRAIFKVEAKKRIAHLK